LGTIENPEDVPPAVEYPLPDQVYFPGPSHYPLRFV
jgi:hypothetical protein